MCCNNGVISRSDPRFSLLPSPTPTPTPIPPTSLYPPSAHIPHTHRSFSRPIVRTRFSSLRPRAAIGDGSIASMPRAADNLSFYELLGIPDTVSYGEIKQAYKQLARRYHPDVSPPGRAEEYTEKFIRVQEAYETLSDPDRRAMYDKDMAMGIHLSFTSRNRYRVDEQMVEKREWKTRWQGQLSQLKRRSMHKDNGENMTWGARMRRQREEFSTEW